MSRDTSSAASARRSTLTTREARGAASAADRLARPLEHPLPARARRPASELDAAVRGYPERPRRRSDRGRRGRRYPGGHRRLSAGLGLPLRLRRGSDPSLQRCRGTSAPASSIDIGAARDGDTAGLSRAVAGVAETGTLALASGADNPVTLGFLPDTHIVVLRADTDRRQL